MSGVAPDMTIQVRNSERLCEEFGRPAPCSVVWPDSCVQEIAQVHDIHVGIVAASSTIRTQLPCSMYDDEIHAHCHSRNCQPTLTCNTFQACTCPRQTSE